MRFQKIIGMAFIALLTMPLLANAEIYKWKDKNGVTRYSDTPPPNNVEAATLRGKRTVKTAKPASEAETGDGAASQAANKTRLKQEPNSNEEADEEAAKMRARNAEIEKNNKRLAKKEADIDAKNCVVARKNFQSYSRGGRIFTVNEQGERVYAGDAEISSGKKRAQADIRKFCK